MSTESASIVRVRPRVRVRAFVTTAIAALMVTGAFQPITPAAAAPVQQAASAPAAKPVELTPEMLRAVLLVREFQERATARGTTADLKAPQDITGEDLRTVVANVVVGLANLESGRQLTDAVDDNVRAAVNRSAEAELVKLVEAGNPAVRSTR
jgi:polyisoprenoid-binding protein YceI